MTDLNDWLLNKSAAKKKLHPELAANAAKVIKAQDPKKPGAEKPDLYAKGKGKGKGGKPTGKKRMVPTRKQLEGKGRTKTEKIAGTVFDSNDQQFMDWLEEKGDLGLDKEAAGETAPVAKHDPHAVLKAMGVAIPSTVLMTLGAQKVLHKLREKKEGEGRRGDNGDDEEKKAGLKSYLNAPAKKPETRLQAATKKIMSPSSGMSSSWGSEAMGREKKAQAQQQDAKAGAGGTSGGLLRGIKRMGTTGANIAAMSNPITGPAMAAKKVMGKSAGFTPNEENEALLRKILNKVQSESTDAG